MNPCGTIGDGPCPIYCATHSAQRTLDLFEPANGICKSDNSSSIFALSTDFSSINLPYAVTLEKMAFNY